MSMKQEAAATSSTSNESSGPIFKRPGSDGDGSDITYVRLGKLSKGDTVVEGIYLGSSQNAMYPEKKDFKFKTADEKTVVVNEGGNLAFRLKEIAAGTLVRIIYNGMQEITKGPRKGKKSHNVDLLVAE